MRKIISRLVSGLRWRLLLLVLLACAPLVGLTLHTASEERRRLVKDWKQRSQEMMELATREEAQVIGQTRQLLLALAESAPVRSGNRRDAKKLLDELFGSYPRYANLGVVRTNGMVLASARPLVWNGQTPNEPPVLPPRAATRAFAIGDFPDGQAVGKPTVNFGYPVFDAAGQVQAVVFATLDLDWVSRFESALPAQLPPGATWTEIDRTGKILVRYPAPEKWIGQPFPDKVAFENGLQPEARRGGGDVGGRNSRLSCVRRHAQPARSRRRGHHSRQHPQAGSLCRSGSPADREPDRVGNCRRLGVHARLDRQLPAGPASGSDPGEIQRAAGRRRTQHPHGAGPPGR